MLFLALFSPERLQLLVESLLWPHLILAVCFWATAGFLWAWVRWYWSAGKRLKAANAACAELEARAARMADRQARLSDALKARPTATEATIGGEAADLLAELGKGPLIAQDLRLRLSAVNNRLSVTEAALGQERVHLVSLRGQLDEVGEQFESSRQLLVAGHDTLRASDEVGAELCDPISHAGGTLGQAIDRVLQIKTIVGGAEDSLDAGLDSLAGIRARSGNLEARLVEVVVACRSAEFLLRPEDGMSVTDDALAPLADKLASIESELAEVSGETGVAVQQLDDLDSDLETGYEQLTELSTSLWSFRDFAGNILGGLRAYLSSANLFRHSAVATDLETAADSIARGASKLGGIGVSVRDGEGRIAAERRNLHETINQLHGGRQGFVEQAGPWSRSLMNQLGTNESIPLSPHWNVFDLERQAPQDHQCLDDSQATYWMERELEVFELRSQLEQNSSVSDVEAIETSGWRMRVVELESEVEQRSSEVHDLREKLEGLNNGSTSTDGLVFATDLAESGALGLLAPMPGIGSPDDDPQQKSLNAALDANSELRGELAELRLRMAGSDDESELQEEVSLLESRLREFGDQRDQIESLKNRLAVAEDTIEDRESQIAALGQKEKLWKSCEDTSDVIEEAESRVVLLEGEVVGRDERIQELEEELNVSREEADLELRELELTGRELQEQQEARIASSESKLEELQQRVADFGEKESKAAELEGAQAKIIEALELSLADRETRIQDLDAKLTDASGRIAGKEG